jgi:hypothetical protein
MNVNNNNSNIYNAARGNIKYDKTRCIQLLLDMRAKLLSEGDTRYPRRSDFTDIEVMAIKTHLGPWPRALEAAGIKPPRDESIAQRAKEKRIRAKRKKTEYKKAAKAKEKML